MPAWSATGSGPMTPYALPAASNSVPPPVRLVRLERPYDWLVVSDHAEYLGLPQAFAEGDPDIMKTASGKKWAEDLKKGGQAGYEAFVQMTAEFADGKPSIPAPSPGEAVSHDLGRDDRSRRTQQQAGQVHRLHRLRVDAKHQGQQPPPGRRVPRRGRQNQAGAAILGIRQRQRRGPVEIHGRLRGKNRWARSGHSAQSKSLVRPDVRPQDRYRQSVRRQIRRAACPLRPPRRGQPIQR